MTKSVSIEVKQSKSGHEAGQLAGLADIIGHFSAGNSNIGQLRLALVDKVDLRSGTATLYVISDKISDLVVDYPGFMVSPDGSSGFWYGLERGDVVICSIGYGNQYFILNKINNISPQLSSKILSGADIQQALFGSPSSSPKQAVFGDLLPGTFLLKSGNSNIKVSYEKGVFIGNLGYGSINFDINESLGYRNNYTSIVSNQLFNIMNSGYSINGIILRDKSTNSTGDTNQYNDPRLYTKWYQKLTQIGFDPTLIISERTQDTVKRNPALVEKRDVVYEFSDDMFIESDILEARKQNDTSSDGSGANTYINDPLTSRRIRKDDCFSLSLISPNYLIEKTEGTAVDINGNILDLNRNILPVGDIGLDTTISSGSGFSKLQELYRRSIAFHWELNARKDPTYASPEIGSGNTYAISGTPDPYKRDRSRFFFDLDKEGQFKLNVPCSSEIGNVGLMVRAENYTTINPFKKDSDSDYNYDYFVKKPEATVDILLDQYGLGVTDVKGDDKLKAKDRITSNIIKVGTVFHDISKTCVYPVEYIDNNPTKGIKPQVDADNQFRTGILYGPDYYTIDADQQQRDLLRSTSPFSIITKEIIVDKNNVPSANAGGRSGTAIFDGMLNINIGANTVDKQSLWLDLQGGCVQRIGCDKNGISSATQTDGDFYLQIGGDPGFRDTAEGISPTDPDPRFDPTKPGNKTIVVPSANKTNTFEIRVIQGNGQYCRIIINNKGILIASPKTIELRSDEDILLNAVGSIRMSAEDVKFHADDIINNLSVPLHRQTIDINKVYEPDDGGGVLLPKPFMGSGSILNR